MFKYRNIKLMHLMLHDGGAKGRRQVDHTHTFVTTRGGDPEHRQLLVSGAAHAVVLVSTHSFSHCPVCVGFVVSRCLRGSWFFTSGGTQTFLPGGAASTGSPGFSLVLVTGAVVRSRPGTSRLSHTLSLAPWRVET